MYPLSNNQVITKFCTIFSGTYELTSLVHIPRTRFSTAQNECIYHIT